MLEVNYSFAPPTQIKVNGHVFTLQKSDAEIYDHALKLGDKYRKLNATTPPRTIMKAVQECVAIIDGILGDGAMKIISEGKSVCLTDTLAIMLLITERAIESYNGKLAAYDE